MKPTIVTFLGCVRKGNQWVFISHWKPAISGLRQGGVDWPVVMIASQVTLDVVRPARKAFFNSSASMTPLLSVSNLSKRPQRYKDWHTERCIFIDIYIYMKNTIWACLFKKGVKFGNIEKIWISYIVKSEVFGTLHAESLPNNLRKHIWTKKLEGDYFNQRS